MLISSAGMFGNSPKRDFGFVRAYAQALEGLGFHALSVPEHVVFFASYASKYPCAADPRACTIRSGMRSWSKWVIFSRRMKSSSSVGPRSPALSEF